MSRNSFGTPGFDGKRMYIKDQKLKAPKQGESVTHLVGRIVPQMKSLRDDPDGWSQFVKYHYGHNGVGRMPGKTVPRTFACIEVMDFKTKEIKVHCPKCDEMYTHKAEEKRLEKAVEDAGGKGKNATLDALLQAEKDWLFANSLSMGYKMYIVTPTEEIIRLQLSGKARKALLAFLKNQKDEKGIQALDLDEGVHIDFMRTGFGRETQDSFSIATTMVDVPGIGKVPLPIKAPLSDAMLDRILKDCTDLTQTETVLTEEQIRMLVESDGSPDETDRIFALGTAPAAERQLDPEESEESSETTTGGTQLQGGIAGTSHTGGGAAGGTGATGGIGGPGGAITVMSSGTGGAGTGTTAGASGILPLTVETPPPPGMMQTFDLARLIAENPGLAAQISALTQAATTTTAAATSSAESPTESPLKKSDADFFAQFPDANK